MKLNNRVQGLNLGLKWLKNSCLIFTVFTIMPQSSQILTGKELPAFLCLHKRIIHDN